MNVRRLVTLLGILLGIFSLVGCQVAIKRHRDSAARMHQYPISDLPLLQKGAPLPVKLGGFSGLHFVEKKGRHLVFLTVTDRGPNGAAFRRKGLKLRPFLMPEFIPEVVRISLDTRNGRVRLLERTKLRLKGERYFSGLPNISPKQNLKFSDEVPVDLVNQELYFDSHGIDPEGITVDRYGNTWVVEEYGPSILELNDKMEVVARYIPQLSDGTHRHRYGKPVLPAWVADRKRNRGFEGVATLGTKLYVFLQSPLPKTGPKAMYRLIRILEFDVKTRQTTGVFAYLLETPRADKIGGATIDQLGRLLVIERDAKKGNRSFKRIYSVDLTAATNLLNHEWTSRLETLNEKQLLEKSIIVARKKLLYDLAKMGVNNVDKVEGIALVDGGRLALITDNDFDVPHLVRARNSGVRDKKSEQAYMMLLRR